MTIGWREWVSFPHLMTHKIKAKIDTGARTSCLDTDHYDFFENEGDKWVRFSLQSDRKNPGDLLTFESPLSSYKIVRDSGGHEVLRPFIKTQMKIGDLSYEIELSLSNRSKMKFGVLIGRVALKDRFLVDVGKDYLIGQKGTTSDP